MPGKKYLITLLFLSVVVQVPSLYAPEIDFDDDDDYNDEPSTNNSAADQARIQRLQEQARELRLRVEEQNRDLDNQAYSNLRIEFKNSGRQGNAVTSQGGSSGAGRTNVEIIDHAPSRVTERAEQDLAREEVRLKAEQLKPAKGKSSAVKVQTFAEKRAAIQKFNQAVQKSLGSDFTAQESQFQGLRSYEEIQRLRTEYEVDVFRGEATPKVEKAALKAINGLKKTVLQEFQKAEQARLSRDYLSKKTALMITARRNLDKIEQSVLLRLDNDNMTRIISATKGKGKPLTQDEIDTMLQVLRDALEDLRSEPQPRVTTGPKPRLTVKSSEPKKPKTKAEKEAAAVKAKWEKKLGKN